MSAYVVDKEHIDYLVRAGLTRGGEHGSDNGLRWFDPSVPDGERDYEPGAMMGGPTAHETFEAKRRELTPETADRVGAMLWSENARSVSYRYNGEEYGTLPGPSDFDEMALASYVFVDPARLPIQERRVMVAEGYKFRTNDPVAVLKACDGYEYQSCEHPGWRTSEACAFLDALRRKMIRALPGYADADWSVSA